MSGLDHRRGKPEWASWTPRQSIAGESSEDPGQLLGDPQPSLLGEPPLQRSALWSLKPTLRSTHPGWPKLLLVRPAHGAKNTTCPLGSAPSEVPLGRTRQT